MPKPNFMIVGAGKCGTSTICGHLRRHPEIFFTEPKEPHFFSVDSIYERGIEWYESLYSGVDKEISIGEGSNTYTARERFPNAAERIFSYAPKLKLVYCVRDPIKRIESLWLEKRSHGGESVHYDFNKAVEINRNALVDSANYWKQINVYREKYSDANIHIIFFEDFVRDPQGIMNGCFEFLDVARRPLDEPELHTAQTAGRSVPRKSLSKLRALKLFRASAKLVPESLREVLKEKFLFKKMERRPQWSPGVREWVADVLEEDTKEFLKFYGKPTDFWQLRNAQLSA